MTMSDLNSLIAEGARKLFDSGIPEPRREAASLLAFAIGKDRTFIIAHPEYVPTDAENDRYSELISRRASREPFHYITGKKEFFGLDFKVTPAVLIPRPETEMLVEQAIGFLSERPEPLLCEIGVGSGCISIAVLVNLSNSKAVGVDISDAAIAVAKENALFHGVENRFNLRNSDLFSALANTEKFDLIVSNPPYISSDDFVELEPDVREFEPKTALTDGGDGLSIIERIVAGAADFLASGGCLMMEIGHDQEEKVIGMFDRGRWKNVNSRPDFQGIRRTVSAVFDK